MNLNTPTKPGLYWYINDLGVWTVACVENVSYHSIHKGWYKTLQMYQFGDEEARDICEIKFGPEITRYTGE